MLSLQDIGRIGTHAFEWQNECAECHHGICNIIRSDVIRLCFALVVDFVCVTIRSLFVNHLFSIVFFLLGVASFVVGHLLGQKDIDVALQNLEVGLQVS